MTVTVYEYFIEGTSPLLMHNPAGMLVPKDNKPTTKAKSIPAPADEAEAGTYRAEDGRLYFPMIGAKRGVLLASTGKKIGKNAAPKMVRAGLFEADERMFFYHPETKEPLFDYEIFSASVVIMRSRVVHHRPKVWPWAATVLFEVNDDYLAPQHVNDLLEEAGKLAGLGDWRPEKSGRYGRYRVTGYQAIETAVREAAE